MNYIGTKEGIYKRSEMNVYDKKKTNDTLYFLF